ncbi:MULTISPECIES: hypothetical protein [unclassified Bradyrhizobium]
MITTLADIDPKRVAAIRHRSEQDAYKLLADLAQESHAARRARHWFCSEKTEGRDRMKTMLALDIATGHEISIC